MMSRISVERHEDSKLRGQIWYFYFFDDGRFVLDQYLIEQRETTRHKFKPVKVWKRQDSRNLSPTIKIEKEADVPLPDDVKAEAMKQLVDQIKIGKPSELGMS